MNLKSYLTLHELLEFKPSTKTENRAFGLMHVTIKNNPKEQLLLWIKEHSGVLKKPHISERFSSYLYAITLILVLIAFLLGIISGVGLLSYNGEAPVNVIYFMAIVILVPLFTMFLTLISMLRASRAESLLVHISPAFWMEKIVGFLPYQIQENIKDLELNPLIANWLVIKRSQLIALFFSLGLLISLLAVVVTKDIAFSWSTTLDISPKTFYDFLYTVSFPWREFYLPAVPSLELIEHSQYFRLGENLSEEMVNHASQLGLWWKFLVFSTIFYAILLRFGMFILASLGLKKAVEKSFLSLQGVMQLLREMNEPIISTHALSKEDIFVESQKNSKKSIADLDNYYDVIQGWAISYEELVVLSDSMQVISPKHFGVGGRNSFTEDTEIVDQSHGKILFFVKGWEPPTMDFVDYLTELTQKVDRVILKPIGTLEDQYKPTDRALDIWERKLTSLNNKKVWFQRWKV